jgi:hypothetical protein
MHYSGMDGSPFRFQYLAAIMHIDYSAPIVERT